MKTENFKDAVLDRLADSANIAQFVSFAPDGTRRFRRIYGIKNNFLSPRESIQALIQNTPDKMVNVRCFRPEQSQGNEFVYGLGNIDDVEAHVRRLTRDGFYVIINETVDVNDGGVSGVLQAGCMEFAPGVVPRFVEKNAGDPVPALPRELAEEMLTTIYGFAPDLGKYDNTEYRVEFSIHPKARGLKHKRTIIWEEEKLPTASISPFFSWPNPFSRLLGDKAYGLLLAHLFAMPVPRCTVFPKNPHISPFTFGLPTGGTNRWTRTCPKQQDPGRFSTLGKWVDPFALMAAEDPGGNHLASCIFQDEVSARYSGALITNAQNEPIIEGTEGYGNRFMVGEARPAAGLPSYISNDVLYIYRLLQDILKDGVRFEWAHDGAQIWILQLHKGLTASLGRTIFPGEPQKWLDFPVSAGLAALRSLIAEAIKTGAGVRVIGNVGMSSHIADVLRKDKVPSKMAPAPTRS